MPNFKLIVNQQTLKRVLNMQTPKQFKNRQDAGQTLAASLKHYANRNDVLVLGLARGGVPVAYEVAKALSAPMDVFIVRKLGVPGHDELAMGAIASDDVVIYNQSILRELQLEQAHIDKVIAQERAELFRRLKVYRGERPMPDLKNKQVILVDDGIATGASIRAAVEAIRQAKPARLIIAVPIAASDTVAALKPTVDELVCVLQPVQFMAVGQWYEDFTQTSDEEVMAILAGTTL